MRSGQNLAVIRAQSIGLEIAGLDRELMGGLLREKIADQRTIERLNLSNIPSPLRRQSAGCAESKWHT
jgi:hypothetical protein